jgi:hypothetical protein
MQRTFSTEVLQSKRKVTTAITNPLDDITRLEASTQLLHVEVPRINRC